MKAHNPDGRVYLALAAPHQADMARLLVAKNEHAYAMKEKRNEKRRRREARSRKKA